MSVPFPPAPVAPPPSVPFADPDPYRELRYPSVLAAKLAIADYLGFALAKLSAEGVPIWAVAYKDAVAATAGFLGQHGSPYARVARDADGLTAINWGVYGVPETYLVDGAGIIRRKFVGPITPEIAAAEVRPLLRRLA